MPTTYEKAYGSVKFYEPDGTAIFDTEGDLGLWTSVDEEPSPDPKWVRVDVPGADGAVDLSRALAGQVTYETREITLGFVGSCADHAAALALVRQMRSALHGARVRVETVLTARIGGWYLADCECDGTAYAGGEVEVEVKAWADPFIRVGTQTLALAGTSSVTKGPASRVDVPASFARGVGSLTAEACHGTGTYYSPLRATTARLWYAHGADANKANLLDVTTLRVSGYDNDGIGANVHSDDVYATGHVIDVGALVSSHYKTVVLSPYRRGASGFAPDCEAVGIPLVSGNKGYTTSGYVGVYLSGTVDSVNSPSISLGRFTSVMEVDQYGVPTTYTSSQSTMTVVGSLTARTYDGTLVAYASTLLADPVNAYYLEFNGIESTGGLKAQLVLVAGSPTTNLPQVWREPDVGYVDIDLGGTFCRTTTDGDVAVISPLGVTVTHNCALSAKGYVAADLGDPYVTTGAMGGWLPEDATHATFSAVNAYGEDCPIATSQIASRAIGTASGSNLTMRSTPTVTTTGGAYVSIGGRDAIVGAGTHELPSLTIPAGAFTVGYATLDGSAGTLAWEGGVL